MPQGGCIKSSKRVLLLHFSQMDMFYSGSLNKILIQLIHFIFGGVFALSSLLHLFGPCTGFPWMPSLPSCLRASVGWGTAWRPSPNWKQCLIFLWSHHFFPRENLHNPPDSDDGPPYPYLWVSQPLHCSCYYRRHFTFNCLILYYCLDLSPSNMKSGIMLVLFVFLFSLLTSSIYVPATE